MLAIFKREFISYFKSPVGYIALALFSFISGYLFSISFDEQYISMAANILNVCSFFIINKNSDMQKLSIFIHRSRNK